MTKLELERYRLGMCIQGCGRRASADGTRCALCDAALARALAAAKQAVRQ